MEKRCTYCFIVKPLEEFGKQKTGKDGINSRCKICVREINDKWKKDNPDKVKQHSKTQNKKYCRELYRELYGDECDKYLEAKDNDEIVEECIKNGTECEYLGISMDLYKKWIEFNWYGDMTWENRNADKEWRLIKVDSFTTTKDDYLKWFNTIPVSYYDFINGSKHLRENLNDKIDRFKFLYLEDRIFK